MPTIAKIPAIVQQYHCLDSFWQFYFQDFLFSHFVCLPKYLFFVPALALNLYVQFHFYLYNQRFCHQAYNKNPTKSFLKRFAEVSNLNYLHNILDIFSVRSPHCYQLYHETSIFSGFLCIKSYLAKVTFQVIFAIISMTLNIRT